MKEKLKKKLTRCVSTTSCHFTRLDGEKFIVIEKRKKHRRRQKLIYVLVSSILTGFEFQNENQRHRYLCG